MGSHISFKFRLGCMVLAGVLAGCNAAGTNGQEISQKAVAPSGGSAMNPPLAYSNIERLQILCLLQSDGMLASADDNQRLCSKVAKEAGSDVDLEVSVIRTGDPQVVAPGRLTLLVHGALDQSGRIALTIRPYRPAATGSEVLFGSMPRVAAFADDDSLEEAISDSLDEVLPWRRASVRSRRIN